MQHILGQGIDELRGAWRYRWPALLAAWAVCVGGWVYVMTLPDLYEASTQVYVDANTGLTPLLQGLAVEQDVDSQLQLVREAILSRPSLEKVARATDLYVGATTPKQVDAMIRQLRSRIEITNVFASQRGGARGGDSLYYIGYLNGEQDKALAVVRQILDTFVEDTLGGKRTGSEGAQRFLEDQIREYARQLNEQEARLAEFKQDNMGLVPGEAGDYFARLERETASVRQARADLALAVSRSEELRRQLRGEQRVSSSLDPDSADSRLASTDTTIRLAEARKRLDELLLRYTDKHPDVVATRETIRQLEERQESELEALRQGAGPTPAALAANPVYQSIQMALNDSEVQVAALRRQIGQGEANIAQLQKLAQTAPEVEARFRELTRDFEVTRAQYTALLERLEKAKLTGEAEETGIVRFDVIDPPKVSLDPVSPNRPLLILMVLLAGLGIGVALAYLLHMLKPVFNGARGLGDLTGLPVLGAVSATWAIDREPQRRKDLLAYGGAVAGLLVLCMGMLITHGGVSALVKGISG